MLGKKTRFGQHTDFGAARGRSTPQNEAGPQPNWAVEITNAGGAGKRGQ